MAAAVKKRWLWGMIALVVVACLLIGGGVYAYRHAAGRSAAPKKPHATAAAKLPKPSGPMVTATAGPNRNLPAQRAGSGACAKMDAVLSGLLNSPQGRALTAAAAKDHDPNVAPGKMQGSGTQWVAFLGLVQQHKDDFARAAGDDPRAQQALADIDVVADIEPKLLDKRIPKYVDEQDAFEQLEAGRTPAQNPRFLEATRKAAESLDRLSWCMPSWPVQF